MTGLFHKHKESQGREEHGSRTVPVGEYEERYEIPSTTVETIPMESTVASPVQYAAVPVASSPVYTTTPTVITEREPAPVPVTTTTTYTTRYTRPYSPRPEEHRETRREPVFEERRPLQTAPIVREEPVFVRERVEYVEERPKKKKKERRSIPPPREEYVTHIQQPVIVEEVPIYEERRKSVRPLVPLAAGAAAVGALGAGLAMRRRKEPEEVYVERPVVLETVQPAPQKPKLGLTISAITALGAATLGALGVAMAAKRRPVQRVEDIVYEPTVIMERPAPQVKKNKAAVGVGVLGTLGALAAGVTAAGAGMMATRRRPSKDTVVVDEYLSPEPLVEREYAAPVVMSKRVQRFAGAPEPTPARTPVGFKKRHGEMPVEMGRRMRMTS